MSAISLQNISLQFAGHDEPLFHGMSFTIDTQWRCGLIGRNGRGKTTLIRLLAEEIAPDTGTISLPVRALLCPRPDPGNQLLTYQVVRDCVAPFDRWEKELESLAHDTSPGGVERYHRLLHEYESHGGYDIKSRIERECELLHILPNALRRPFSSLSGGEQTRAMIATLFLHRNAFPLLDEPTDHLDLEGRSILASYLRSHNGFLLASHDRDLLDACIDHTIAINRTGTEVFGGPYSVWKSKMILREETERRTSEKIEREVRDLEKAARDRRSWSVSREAEKKAAADSGFVGARAARQMKRALAIERRIERELLEKESLLQDRETVYPLRIPTATRVPELVARIDGAGVTFNGVRIFGGLSIALHRGDRLAILGPNGCGKTTLLRLLTGEQQPDEGAVYRPARISVATVRQHPEWTTGFLREHVWREKLDASRFFTILGALGVENKVFDQRLEAFSYGQRKKVEIARALMAPADVQLWDEPTNAIDLYAREELERAVLADSPTLLFIDHDMAFIRAIATRVLRFVREGGRWMLREE